MSPTQTESERLRDLITSQINFGLAYIEEARTAYGQGCFEYGDLARQIALNAYSTASRFATQLPKQDHPAILNKVIQFKEDVDKLLRQSVVVPSIA